MTTKVHNLVCVVCQKGFTWQFGNPNKGRKPKRCPECIARDPLGRELDKLNTDEKVQISRMTQRFSDFDMQELHFIMDMMGSTQIDAVRTAIRVYATLLRRA